MDDEEENMFESIQDSLLDAEGELRAAVKRTQPHQGALTLPVIVLRLSTGQRLSAIGHYAIWTVCQQSIADHTAIT